MLHRELRTIIIGYSAKDVGDSINYFHKIKLNKLSREKAQFFVAEKKKREARQLVEGGGGAGDVGRMKSISVKKTCVDQIFIQKHFVAI